MTQLRINQGRSLLGGTMSILGGIGALVTVFVLVTVWLGIYTVDEGQRGIVKRWGSVNDVTMPGVHVKLPYVDTVDFIEVRERAFSMNLEAASKDPMELPIGVTVNWLVKADRVKDLYVQYGSLDQFEKRIIQPRLPDAVKGVTSLYTVNDLLRKRVEYRDASFKAFTDVMPDDVQITAFAVTNIGFPPEYTQAMKDKQVARETTETEAFKLQRQDLQAQQATQTASAQANANKLLADAEAYKIKQQGEAQAAAIAAMGKALTDNPRVIEYEKVKRWGGEFPSTFMGGENGANLLWSLPAQNTPAPAPR